MYFQKSKYFLCSIILCIALFVSSTSVALAAGEDSAGGHDIELTKVMDIALSKAGIHANNNFLQKMQASVLNMLNGTASSYGSYCEANALEKNDESWSSYLASDAYAALPVQVPNIILQAAWFIEWMLCPEDYAEHKAQRDALVSTLAGSASCVQGETYTISDEAVDYVVDVFEDVLKTDGPGYYYVPVHTFSEFTSSQFANADSYNNLRKYIESSDQPTMILYSYASSKYGDEMHIFQNQLDYNLVHAGNGSKTLNFYSDDWSAVKLNYYLIEDAYGDSYINVSFFDMDSFNLETLKSVSAVTTYLETGSYMSRSYMFTKFYGKTAGRQIVYKTLDDFRNYSMGIRPFYMTTNNIYDESVDNSVNVTGDYLIDYADSYSYDTIYNEIVNNNDYSESNVSNIVNSNNETVINNYYYTSDDSGDSGGSGDNNDSGGSGGGLGALIDGIGSVLNFIVTLVGDALTLVTNFLNSIYDLLKGLGGTFAQFTGLLGEMFTFIPQELLDLITAGISVTIAVSLIALLKR